MKNIENLTGIIKHGACMVQKHLFNLSVHTYYYYINDNNCECFVSIYFIGFLRIISEKNSSFRHAHKSLFGRRERLLEEPNAKEKRKKNEIYKNKRYYGIKFETS